MEIATIIFMVVLLCFLLVKINQSLKCEQILTMLDKVQKTDPAKRESDSYDAWFAAHVEDICAYKRTLVYVGQYGYLEDAFWKQVKDPQTNYRLQKNIIKLDEFEAGNLLYHFVSNYDFLPRIKWRLEHFSYFYWTAKIYYENYHKN